MTAVINRREWECDRLPVHACRRLNMFTLAFLFLLPSTSWAECVNPFAGCELVNNTTPFNGTLTRGRVEAVPSPSIPTIDNSLALLEAGVSDTPWRCNTSITWGDIVWNRCRAPDTTICVIEPMIMSPSPYTRRRRTDSISPSPVGLTPCRTSVARVGRRRRGESPSAPI